MTVAVFFPSLMGFGILVSGALIVADLVHRLLPNETTQRRRRLALGVHGAVAEAARAAGLTFPPPKFLERSYRSRLAYAAMTVAAAGLAALVVVGGSAAYQDPKGVFYESPWIFGLTLGGAIAAAIVALTCLVLTLLHTRSPQWLAWIVRSTSLGRVRIPAPADALGHPVSGGDAR